MKVLITGGAGFIGCNVAQAFLQRKDRVALLDNLSRPGSEENLEWLRGEGPLRFSKFNLRDREGLTKFFKTEGPFDAVLHFAGQVAVTTSLLLPLEDFEINAGGTLNLLEAVRAFCPEAVFLFASTNKVYGALEALSLEEKKDRFEFRSLQRGVSEEQPLDFHSPYGCSKGAADQYVRDYARIYGLRSVVLRQSCVYGSRQFGVEDQGWVAWFMIARELDLPVTVYGDGKQVRDLLSIQDLVRVIFQALDRIDEVRGEVFNIGGGSENTLSILELLNRLKRGKAGSPWKISFADARRGDQRVYVSDIQKAARLLDWRPSIFLEEGLNRLQQWVSAHRNFLERLHSEKRSPRHQAVAAPL